MSIKKREEKNHDENLNGVSSLDFKWTCQPSVHFMTGTCRNATKRYLLFLSIRKRIPLKVRAINKCYCCFIHFWSSRVFHYGLCLLRGAMPNGRLFRPIEMHSGGHLLGAARVTCKTQSIKSRFEWRMSGFGSLEFFALTISKRSEISIGVKKKAFSFIVIWGKIKQ